MTNLTAQHYKALTRFKKQTQSSKKTPPYPRFEQKKTKLVATSPLEDKECFDLVQFLEWEKEQKRILYFTHIANGARITQMATRVKLKRLGVRKGFPDYVVITANFKVIYIEMKRLKGGRPSPEQLVWIEALRGTGAVAQICNGFEEAKALLLTYM